MYSATYTPEDNKLRLYAAARLDADTYARVRAAGFIWAPKQELFVAPAWTPQREDLLIELAGEIGDEDKSLVERQEERAERFDGYSDSRKQDADSAHAAVERICDGIPLGQPILVGHHSERHARKDAQRIENGMRKAVKMWETSKYWTQRAAGAIAHAKYKELPRVRARRIKGLIADIRRCKAAYTPVKGAPVIMQQPFNESLKNRDCEKVPHVYVGQGRAKHWIPQSCLESLERGYARWIQHYELRLEYEKAMLNEQGAGELLEPKARPAQLPICNYRAESITSPSRYTRGEMETLKQVELTKKQFQAINEDYRGTREAEHSHRVRVARVELDDEGNPRRFPSFKSGLAAVFLTDSKIHEKPAPVEVAPVMPRQVVREYTPRPVDPEAQKFDALRDTLKTGIKVVAAPQLFPTPAALAARMIEVADIQAGQRVLEPSAGTGAILRAACDAVPGVEVVAVEVNHDLALSLTGSFGHGKDFVAIKCADFLSCNGDLGTFDRIVMNPPFENGSDIQHIRHAYGKLRPGGRLVAICANGPRQRAALMPLVEQSGGTWEDLPAGSFETSGTGVNTAMIVLEA